MRDAITAANNNASEDGCVAGNGDDRIEFNLPPTTITLTSSLPAISQSLEIAGPGIDRLTIDGGESHAMISASFFGGFFTMRDLELFRGSNISGGCVLIGNVKTILIGDVKIISCTSTFS